MRFSQWSRAAPGTRVIRDGDVGDFFCFLAEGELKVLKNGLILDMLTTGECFGEMAVLGKSTCKRGADIVGPLLIEPRRRRGRAVRISEAGQTLTTDGLITGVVAEGELDQGQLDGARVLGVNACGMLVRASVWEALGGLDPALPSSIQGLEFSWRARLAGHDVVTQPNARVVHVEAATRGLRHGITTDPEEERRRWGLALHEAFRDAPLGAGGRNRLRLASTRRAVGHVLGKDLMDARGERRAVRAWARDRDAVARLHASYERATEAGATDVSELRLSRAAVRSRGVDELFGRAVDWLSEFGDRGGGPGLDALTGGDFARDDQTRRRLSPTWIFAWVFVAAALVSARSLFSFAPLSGPQLAPVPSDFGALFARFADPVAGIWPSAGAPWIGLVWLSSLVTIGHPDIVVSLALLGCVPVCFLMARRVLGQLVEDQGIALLGGGLYALVPVVSGAVGSGQLGTVVWAMALPLVAHQLIRWWDEGDVSWQVVGLLALSATVLTAVEPLTWLPVALAVAALKFWAGGTWPRTIVAAFGPLLLLATPFTAELVRFPGRLLTGIDPVLAPSGPPTILDLVLARPVAEAAPLWVSAGLIGVLWVLALAGAAYRRTAVWGIVAALACAAVAVGLTRLVVEVPPTGMVARPQASVWLIGMVAGLIGAAAYGLEGVRAEIAHRGFGPRHVVVYAGAVLAAATLLGGSAWWVMAGTGGLQRAGDTALPAFIRKDAERSASRILALDLAEGTGRWAVLSGDLTRLGDGERGLAEGGDPTVDELAASVATRLGAGAEDERIVPDLQRLGVGYLWVTGAAPDQRAAISNVPGLGVGSVDAQGANWVVPASGRLVLVTGTVPAKQDPAELIPAGAEGRVLLVAEPLTDPPIVTIGGVAAQRLPDVDGRLAFAVPGAGGALAVTSAVGPPWWAIVPALALLALIILAAPSSNAAEDARERAPRRADRKAS